MVRFKNKEAEARAGTNSEKQEVHQGVQDGNWMFECVSCVASEKNIPVRNVLKEIPQQRTGHDVQRCTRNQNDEIHVLLVWNFLQIDAQQASEEHHPFVILAILQRKEQEM